VPAGHELTHVLPFRSGSAEPPLHEVHDELLAP